MQGGPQRLALRDFTVWPSGPKFARAGDRERFQQHVQEEKEHMWDHSLP
jgi:hydroxyacylglutathione hydrolase